MEAETLHDALYSREENPGTVICEDRHDGGERNVIFVVGDGSAQKAFK
jgi:hypothetical protein